MNLTSNSTDREKTVLPHMMVIQDAEQETTFPSDEEDEADSDDDPDDDLEF
jgi:hypothetical protein